MATETTMVAGRIVVLTAQILTYVTLFFNCLLVISLK